jgi:hypothetical protein
MDPAVPQGVLNHQSNREVTWWRLGQHRPIVVVEPANSLHEDVSRSSQLIQNLVSCQPAHLGNHEFWRIHGIEAPENSSGSSG